MFRKINVHCLALEITNICNMECPHCLRGNSGNAFMDKKIIDTVFQQVLNFAIIFTGGEPSLYPEAIQYATDLIISQNKFVPYFFVATNGKKYSQPMVSALIDLYAYIKGVLKSENFSELALSKDKYHAPIASMNEYRYRSLSFFSESRMYLRDEDVINEGLAALNGIGARSIEKPQIRINTNSFSKHNIDVDNTVYINVFGDVSLECDYSHDSKEKYKLGNVLERPLFDILYDAAIEAGFKLNEY